MVKYEVMSVTKNILPVVVGAMSGMMLIRLGERLIHKMYPINKDIDVNNMQALEQAIRQMPGAAFVSLLVNHMVCSLIAGVVATLVGGRLASRPAIITGVILTVAGVINALMLPHPLWFKAANFLIYIPLAYVGYILARKKPVGASI